MAPTPHCRRCCLFCSSNKIFWARWFGAHDGDLEPQGQVTSAFVGCFLAATFLLALTPQREATQAPSSLSTDLSLAHRPPELLSSIQPHATSLPALTTPLIIGCVSERPNCTGTFQCRSMNEHATPRSLSSEESGRGSRSSGCLVVVVVSSFALLGRCVVRRSTGRRLFFVFRPRVTSPRASRSSARSARWAVLLCRPAIAGISLR